MSSTLNKPIFQLERNFFIYAILCIISTLTHGQGNAGSFDPLALVSNDRKSEIAAERNMSRNIQREINFLNELPQQTWKTKSTDLRGHDLLFHYRHKNIITAEPPKTRENMDGIWRVKSTKLLSYKFVAGAGYQSAANESDLVSAESAEDLRGSTLIFAAPDAYSRDLELVKSSYFVGLRVFLGQNGLAYSDLFHAAPYRFSGGRLCILRGAEDCYVALRSQDGSAYLRQDSGPNAGLIYKVVTMTSGDPIGLEKLSEFWSKNPSLLSSAQP